MKYATTCSRQTLAVTLKETTLKKFCVFCGEKPASKNKEHIIPQWLIRMTGDPNREINLGIDLRHLQKTGEEKIRTFSFKSFQFPACESCNTEFASLEGKVKSIFERLFENEYFTNNEIDTLLDWFDKVRIGLWLGSITLDDFVDFVNPKFHIKKRIAHRDRCLFTYEMEKTDWKGVQFIGFNSPGFQFIPSCFSLRVNHLFFFNYSFDFLFAKNIGFPFPKIFKNNALDTRLFELELEKGNGKISAPIINHKFIKASSYIYQPIIPTEVYGTELEKYYKLDKYVQENCLDYENRKGDIFYYENGLQKLDNESELLLTNSQPYNSESFPNIIARQTFDCIESLIKLKPHKLLENEEKRIGIEKNRLMILNAHRNFASLLKKKSYS
jgi:hypothetical protein